MDSCYLDFLIKDIEKGLLKNKRVGMKRRTLKFIDGVKFEELINLPYGFVVLNVKGRFE